MNPNSLCTVCIILVLTMHVCTCGGEHSRSSTKWCLSTSHNQQALRRARIDPYVQIYVQLRARSISTYSCICSSHRISSASMAIPPERALMDVTISITVSFVSRHLRICQYLSTGRSKDGYRNVMKRKKDENSVIKVHTLHTSQNRVTGSARNDLALATGLGNRLSGPRVRRLWRRSRCSCSERSMFFGRLASSRSRWWFCSRAIRRPA